MKDNKKTLIIITVGTSLLDNEPGSGRESDSRVRCYVDQKDPWKDEDASPPCPYEAAGILRNAFLACCGSSEVGSLGYELNFRNPNEDGRDMLPQELSYLAILAGALDNNGITALLEEDEPVKLALLASDSNRGRFSANVIRQLLTLENPAPEPRELWRRFEDAEVHEIEGLQTEDKDEFESEGVPNLIAKINELASEEPISKVIINFTGGFKGAIPYTTLASYFLPTEKEVRLHYLFHDTPHILELPVYPIGLDFAKWHSEAALLDTAKSQQHYKYYKTALSGPMATVARENQRQQNGLPAILEERYRHLLEQDQFQIYSKRVIEQFLKDDQELRDNLVPLVEKVGTLIWYGDKLPMAADHTANHHHHLLEFAQLLLTPIMDVQVGDDNNNQPFLNLEERYVLLAALLLHDCGHTVDTVTVRGRTVPLLTSEIRTWHHVLAYLRLNQKDNGLDRTSESRRPMNGKTSRLNQEDNGLDWKPIEKDYAGAIPWLCLYHRKSTGWREQNHKTEFPYTGETFPCPGETAKCFKNDIDLLKLVALLRFIDGCDNQSRRVGPPPKTSLMEKTLKRDAKTWKDRFFAMMDKLLDSEKKEELKSVLNECPRNGNDDSPCLSKKNFNKVLEIARKAGAESGSPSPLVLELIRLYDEWRLRASQYPHLVKHEAVKRIMVCPDDDFEENSTWSFSVIIEPQTQLEEDLDNNNWARNKLSLGECRPNSLREWITQEIEKEMPCEAKEYLDKVTKKQWRINVKWTDKC